MNKQAEPAKAAMTNSLIICLSGGISDFANQYDWRMDGRQCRRYEINDAPGEKSLWDILAGRLSQFAEGLALINYPVPFADTHRLKLYLPNSAHGDPRQEAIPAELRDNLADYHDGASPTGNAKLYKDHEQIFAEQAAAARIITEHSARLALAHGPDAVCIGFGGMSAILGLRGLHPGYHGLYLDQIMHHTASLARRLGAATVLCLADGSEAQQPFGLHFAAPEREPKQGGGPLSLNDLLRMAVEADYD